MRRGDFAAAWAVSERLMRSGAARPRPEMPRHLQAVWTGRPVVDQRVLVRCYHGLGDTLQFIRFIPMLRQRARQVVVWVQPALIPLLGGLDGIDHLLPLHDGAPEAEYDVDVELMEVPWILGVTLATLPASVPYLRVDAMAIERSHRPAVGLVWRAGDWAAHRSIPFALLNPLLDAPVTWYVVQGGSGLDERPPHFGILAGNHDLTEAARAIAALDLLITVDSMPAHLAGAIATPVWTLLPASADWRWMLDREDSPWYPTMRLFRQERDGEWGPVIERAARELRAFAAA